MASSISSTSSSQALDKAIIGQDKNKEYEARINAFLAEVRDSKSSRSGSGGQSSSGIGGYPDDVSRKKKAIRDLQQLLASEMPDMSDEHDKLFYDMAMTKTFEMLVGSATNPSDVKAGIMLMCILLDAPSEKNKSSIIAPFANHLRKVNLINDLELLDLVACAVGKIALNSGSSTKNFVEFEISRAIEIINNDRNDIPKRHSAILNLRELASVNSTNFFNNIMLFFESIFIAIKEPKLREPAINCLRSALYVVVERELSAFLNISTNSSKISRIDQQIPKCFEICFEEVIKGFYDADGSSGGTNTTGGSSSSSSKQASKDRDDKIHASLLILNELLRCSHDSSVILRDSISRELGYLYINMQDFTDMSTFDYPLLFSPASLAVCGAPHVGVGGVVGSGASGSSASGSSLNAASSMSTTYKSSTYLTKIFRKYPHLESSQSQSKLYSIRDLNGVVNYHKEMGIAPILSFFKKSRPSTLSTACHQLLTQNFDQVTEHIINQMYQRNANRPQTNQVILMVLPSLVSLDAKQFCAKESYVNDSITYLLHCVRQPQIKSLAFISLGLFVLAIKDGIGDGANKVLNPHLQLIIQQIRQSFPLVKDGSTGAYHHSKKRSNQQLPDPAVFTCLAFLAQAVGTKIEQDIAEMLPSMFQLGLTEPLANSLYDICNYLPDLTQEIHEGLFKILSQIIMDKKTLNKNSDNSQQGQGSDTVDLATVRLALKVLGRFDFRPAHVIYFIHHCCNYYLVHDDREVRLEAVHTCCHLLKPFLKPQNPREMITKKVLRKLIEVGINDIDKYVRYSVLSRLDPRFDYYLAQVENLQTLQYCLYDEVFEIRELGICIMSRLSSLNPAYVMPFIRTILLQLLTELDTSGMQKCMEQSGRMLGHLLAGTPRLVRPYTEPIVKVLLPRLTDPSQAVNTATMSAIGQLAQVSGLEMRAWFDQLFPHILDAIQDTSPLMKREIALWTMARLVENTGIVIEPYWKFPTLLDSLFNILKSEFTKPSHLTRQETLRVLGLLGAVDPYRHKIQLGVIDLSGESLISYDPTEEHELNMTDMLSNLSNSFDDYYAGQAISTLMKVMKDPSASGQHTMAVQATAFIFSVLKVRSVPYIPHVLPPFINVIRTGEIRTKEFLLQQLGQMILIVNKHIRAYLEDIFKVMLELWNTSEQMQITLFTVLENMVIALGGEFRYYAPHLVPHVLKVLHSEYGSKEVLLKMFQTLQCYGSTLEDYIHMLIPAIVRRLDADTSKKDNEVRIAALKTLETLNASMNISAFSTLIVHSIARTINNNANDKRLVSACMDLLLKICYDMGSHYQVHISLMAKVLAKHKIVVNAYDTAVQNILEGKDPRPSPGSERDQQDGKESKDRRRTRELQARDQQSPTNQEAKRVQVTLIELHRSWRNLNRPHVSKDDWLDWLRKFNLDLIKESPALTLRSCFPIAQASNNVARDLFNPAFLTCWNELLPEQQREMVELIQRALQEQEIPEVTGTLLNLAEFLEHIDQGAMMFNVKVLGERAMKCRAYAKALHYKEKELIQDGGSTEVLGALININNKLQQQHAAFGVLSYAVAQIDRTKDDKMTLKEKWFEKLDNWETAFLAHRFKYEYHKDDYESILGQMRCMEVLSEWEGLNELSKETFANADQATKQRMARIAVNAAWNLNNWEELEYYVKFIPIESSDSAFYRAVIDVHDNRFTQAQEWIDKARQLIDTQLTTMIGESYNRAYSAMVSVQLMSELEEVIQYKLVPERREMIKQKWWNRLQGCQNVVDDWHSILQVHSLVLAPRDNMRSWLKFARLCDRNNRLSVGFNTITKMMGVKEEELLLPGTPLPMIYPQVTFRMIDYLWMCGLYKRAFLELDNFIQVLESPTFMQGSFAFFSSSNTPTTPTPEYELASGTSLNMSMGDPVASLASQFSQVGLLQNMTPATVNKLLSRAYLRIADAQEFIGGFRPDLVPKLLTYYQKAIEYGQYYYKAWHIWAFKNFQALKMCKAMNPDLVHNLDIPIDSKLRRYGLNPKLYAIQAVKGYFKSISLASETHLQDTLRLLTILFEDGKDDDVLKVVEEGIKNVPIEVWLKVIPQLIARIDIPYNKVAKQLHTLLTDIGKYHPQALIYPLTVASKSAAVSRSQAANDIMDALKVHSPELVSQSMLVSEELIRIAILWHELWHEGLEEASRLYFGDKNVEGMFETLEPLHALTERTPLTHKEMTFNNSYGADLQKAHALVNKYKITQDVKNLNTAWDIYYHVFRRISRQLPTLTSLELQYVSPKLMECKDLELAVPGSYNPKQPIIRICSVEQQINIITSKQRPRKLTIKGSNGRNYMFLLKGHEDLRQDERVMQLFGLVNTLLNSEHITSSQNLSIQRYAVIPLSPNSGLIGWVPHCDTLHSLIRDYREKRKILLNMEHRLMLRMAPDYDRLSLMQKVEVFEYALECTPGDDLAKILWLKSPSSEVWFERRTNYTRSLAVMSMVGYILGLGDRHPSNLMLDRMSGKILHIDFGDCFEVAMTREKYPEKIPFRLTRMLIKAMEVTGLPGTFTFTCQSVMGTMRNHKESMMALLEAFLYDPLLNWRLTNEAQATKPKPTQPQPNFLDLHMQHFAQEDLIAADPGFNAQAEMNNSVNAHLHKKHSSIHHRDVEKRLTEYCTQGLNSKALLIISRVQDKLTGRDFHGGNRQVGCLPQVDRLIKQATSHENLCQCYIGWCPFW